MSDTTTPTIVGNFDVFAIAKQMLEDADDLSRRFPDRRFGEAPRTFDTCCHGDVLGIILATYVVTLHEQIEAMERVNLTLSPDGIRNALSTDYQRTVAYNVGFLEGYKQGESK